MRSEDVFKHFGSQAATARALEVTRSTVNKWGEHPPRGAQFQIEVITCGKFKHDRATFPRARREASEAALA